jgi:hypothetical protein
MPNWILICVNCKAEFQHTRINDVGIANFYLPLKPELPQNTCTCPSCGYTAVYERTDLIYQAT